MRAVPKLSKGSAKMISGGLIFLSCFSSFLLVCESCTISESFTSCWRQDKHFELVNYQFNTKQLFWRQIFTSSDRSINYFCNLLFTVQFQYYHTKHSRTGCKLGQLVKANMWSKYVKRLFLDTFLHPKSKTVLIFAFVLLEVDNFFAIKFTLGLLNYK